MRYSFFDRIIVVAAVILIALALGVAGVQFLLEKQQEEFDSKLVILQRQLAAIDQGLAKVTGESATNSLSLEEVMRRQKVVDSTKTASLTDVVAAATPSVVSIVVSKDVPQLEVSYENPFGDDPFFRNFGIQIPVYRQKGTVKQKVGAGSGFIVTSSGYIFTNRHVVDDQKATYTVLLSNGTQKPASVVYRDNAHDVAVLKIEGTYPALSLGDSGALSLGQSVIAIGNALGEFNNSISVGIISGLNRTIEATDSSGRTEKLEGVIQTDAAINRGNSGGPLLSMDGKVIGINVATVMGSNNVSFSIPVNSIKDVLTKAGVR